MKAPGKHPGGRPALTPGEEAAYVSLRMKPAQKEKLKRLGGGAWVRAQVDAAPEPKKADHGRS